MDKTNKYLGGLLGGALGDAMGAATETRSITFFCLPTTIPARSTL